MRRAFPFKFFGEVTQYTYGGKEYGVYYTVETKKIYRVRLFISVTVRCYDYIYGCTAIDIFMSALTFLLSAVGKLISLFKD